MCYSRESCNLFVVGVENQDSLDRVLPRGQARDAVQFVRRVEAIDGGVSVRGGRFGQQFSARDLCIGRERGARGWAHIRAPRAVDAGRRGGCAQRTVESKTR